MDLKECIVHAMRCGIEQIREGGIGSSAYSQSEQYLIGERFVPLTKITYTMVHPSLGQVLIRQGWEVSFPNVGLNKFVRVASTPRPIPKANNT